MSVYRILRSMRTRQYSIGSILVCFLFSLALLWTLEGEVKPMNGNGEVELRTGDGEVELMTGEEEVEPMKVPGNLTSVLATRRQRLRQYCSTTTHPNIPANPENFHFIERLKPGDLAICVPKKAGSTSLTTFFLTNADSEDTTVWLAGPRLSTRHQILERKSTLKAMVIRHPLARLASAFLHLFRRGLNNEGFGCSQHHTNGSCHLTQNADLAQRIIQHLRPGSSAELLTFQEFVSFILGAEGEFQRLHVESSVWWPGLCKHWEPYYSYCSPCTHTPDLVLELDTLSQEFPVLLLQSGLTRVYGPLPTIERSNYNTYRSTAEVQALYGELTSSQAASLLSYYKEDLAMHGYRPRPYLDRG